MELRYLGIDWGEKRIGLALGDSSTRLASPFRVVNGLKEVLDLVRAEEVDAIVLGLPLKLSGQDRGLTEGFTRFLAELKAASGLPIELFDERLSSKAADALPGEKGDKAPRDAVAAMIILQSYLDKKIAQ